MTVQIPAGYKQTEVGAIPEDWVITEIGAIASVTSGGTPNRKIPEYWGGSIPWVTTSEINSKEILESSEFITTLGLENSAAKIFPAGTLLMAIYGQGKTRGKVAFLGIEASTNQACVGILLSKNVDRYFIFHFLEMKYEDIRGLSNSGSQENLSSEIVKSIKIAIPFHKKEQQAIAEALSDADALIESLEQLIAKKRQIKQGAMQELLTGQRRLPGFSGEWVVKRLEELAAIRSGGTPSTSQPQFWDGDVLWCTPTDITALNGGKYISETSRKITAAGLKASSAEIIPTRSIVMTSRATIGECAINITPVTTNQGFKNFIPFDSVDTEFLYYLLSTQRDGFIGLCSGSTFLEIGKNQLSTYEVLVPNEKSEQTAIASMLSDMDKEIEGLDSRLSKARQIKQGMMQELLTGRIRLIEKT